MLRLGMWLNVLCPCTQPVCALWVLGVSSWTSVHTHPCSPTPVCSQGRCWSHLDWDECANRVVLTPCVSLFVSPPHACAKCRVKKSAFTEPRHSENVGTAEGEQNISCHSAVGRMAAALRFCGQWGILMLFYSREVFSRHPQSLCLWMLPWPAGGEAVQPHFHRLLWDNSGGRGTWNLPKYTLTTWWV